MQLLDFFKAIINSVGNQANVDASGAVASSLPHCRQSIGRLSISLTALVNSEINEDSPTPEPACVLSIFHPPMPVTGVISALTGNKPPWRSSAYHHCDWSSNPSANISVPPNESVSVALLLLLLPSPAKLTDAVLTSDPLASEAMSQLAV
jgi:hypothetical protein